MIARALDTDFSDLPLFADGIDLQAEAVEPRRRGQAPRQPAPPAPPGVMTVATLLDRYAVRRRLSKRTITLYRITLGHFGGFLGHEATVDDLDDDIVSAFLLWRSEQPCRGRSVSAASVEKDRCQILAVWRYGARKRHCREFPDVAGWKVPKRVRDCYTTDDLDKLLTAAAGLQGTRKPLAGKPASWWWRTLLWAAYLTGERRGGLFGLRWRDVDLEACVMTFRAETRKGGRADIVRGIVPALAEELRQQQGEPDDLVWKWAGDPTGWYPAAKALCRRAGVTYHALHGIRRTSASYVARGGGDATAHLGHSSPQVTRDHYLCTEIVGAKNGLEFLPAIGGRSDTK
jgi:integrase